jgi:hypothetical protein
MMPIPRLYTGYVIIHIFCIYSCKLNVFFSQGTLGILEEEFHIKDAVARITVELAKREWPQLWPSLQEDLYKLCQMGVGRSFTGH